MRIQHNILAMNAYRNYTNNTSALGKNLEKLSSGYKINRAGDDAAGLAISEKMRAQITGLNAAQKNVKDGISLVKTAEGAMQEIQDMLNRMDYLATQSANGTYDNEVDRAALQKEVNQLKSEINRIADSANFNGIKLLDGSLSSQNLTADGLTVSTKSVVEGLEIGEGKNGGGSQANATIDVTSLFGTGDTLQIDFTGTGAPSTKTLNFGSGATDIQGETLEEQAESIRNALMADANIAQKFDVDYDGGTKVTLTAKKEGSDEPAVSKITVNDKTVIFGTKDDTNSKAAAAHDNGLTGAAFKTLFGNGTNGNGTQLHAGDQLRFYFKGANNETLVAELTVDEDMLAGDDIAATTTNIVNALKDTYFTDITDENCEDFGLAAGKGTVAKESRFKVSDFFDLTANTDEAGASVGSIKVESKGAGALKGAFAIDTVKLKSAESTTYADFADIATMTKTNGTTGAADGTTPKNIYITKTDDTSNNFTAGDEFTLSGMLSDGRTFNISMIAGKDFDIGANFAATLTNIQNALASDDLKVTLSDKEVVKGSDIFSTGTDGEIKVAAGATGLTFTSQKNGLLTEKIAGGITNAGVTPAEKAAAKTEVNKGTDPTGAESSFTFSKGVGYGTAITVDGKTYELVADERDVTNRSNVAIVLDSLSDTDAIASAFATKIQEQADKNKDADGNAPYTAVADGSTVKITTYEKGSAVKFLEVTTPYGDEVPTTSFRFDPAKIQEGSYMTISDGTNSNTYEFVKAGGTAKSGNIAIEIDDFGKVNAKQIADAFANVAKGATVDVKDDGTVTLTANEVDGSIPKLNITFFEGTAGLKLQIGDTSETYNQLKVSVSDMHTAAVGIEDLDISTQDGAAAAIDVVKNAINYVSGVRGDLGATQNRLEHTANNLSVMAENIQDAESTIRDTDVADEMMAYTKNNILIQSAQAMLAQANQVPQGVLQLLQ